MRRGLPSPSRASEARFCLTMVRTSFPVKLRGAGGQNGSQRIRFERLGYLTFDMTRMGPSGLILSIWPPWPQRWPKQTSGASFRASGAPCQSCGQNGAQSAYFERLGSLVLDVARMGLDLRVLIEML